MTTRRTARALRAARLVHQAVALAQRHPSPRTLRWAAVAWRRLQAALVAVGDLTRARDAEVAARACAVAARQTKKAPRRSRGGGTDEARKTKL